MRVAPALVLLLLAGCLGFPPADACRGECVPGLVIDAQGALFTTENGRSASFEVRLTGAPKADVIVTTASLLLDEAVVVTPVLVFTHDDWDTPQPVIVRGVDDAPAKKDGDVAYAIAVGPTESFDPAFAGLTAQAVGINYDNDAPGFIIDTAGGVVVSEAGGRDTFQVMLRSHPTAPVSLTLDTAPTGRAQINPATITLNDANWSDGVLVAVTGVNDSPPVDDLDETFTLVLGAASSTDPAYASLGAPSVSATRLDDDVAAIVLTSSSARTLLETDPALAVTSVSLATRPVGTVAVPVTVDSTRVSPLTTVLHFNGSNWDVPVSIVVAAVDDSTRNGDAVVHVGFGPASGDTAYVDVNAGPVDVTVFDEERVIVKSKDLVAGDLSTGPGKFGLPSIDAACTTQMGTPFKALLIASTRMPATPSWVVKPGYNYVRLDSATWTVIQRANARGELSDPLQGTTTGADDTYWTGVQLVGVEPNTTWVPGATCSDWSSSGAAAQGTTGSGNAIFTGFAGPSLDCNVSRNVLCVEQ